MKTRFVSLLLFGVLAASGLLAQTKASGLVTCKSDPPAPVAITDVPNHFFAVGKAQCTWTGYAVAGQDSKTGISTDLSEITGDTTSYHGFHVATFANGDTASCRFQGIAKTKDGKPVSGSGTWIYTSGTGKFQGIKGKGTFKGTPNADGTMTYKVEGEYSLP